MRFLALTGTQVFLLAVFTTAVIIALYFLKHRRRRVVVASTQLWKRVLENRLDNSLFERLRRFVSILIAVLTALLVALAIARPEIPWLTGDATRTVLVLDTSPTMQARQKDGKTRWQHAVELAQARVDAASGSTQFRLTDTAGQFDSPFTDNRTELRRLLERMHPVVAPTRFPDIDLAGENSETRVLFITDGVSALRAGTKAETLSVFEEAPNLGITAFEVRPIPTSPLAYEAYLEVLNASKDTRSVDITVSGAGQQRLTKTVRVEAGASYHEALDLSTFEGGGIRAAIHAEGDALSADDVAYTYLPVKRRSRVLLVTTGNKFLENALKLDRLVDLKTVEPKDFDGGKDFDALVLDRFAPQEAPVRPALIVGTPEATWLHPATGFVGNPRFDSWQDTHPALQHVSLSDVSVTSAAKIDASNLKILAASASGTPLIVESERPRWIQLTFAVQNSDFPYHPAFPVFLDNVIALFGREHLALRGTPGIVSVPMLKTTIRTLEGRDVPTQETTDATIFEAAEPGLYVASNGDTRQYVAVNFSSHDFTDINRSKAATGTAPRATSAPLLRREPWFYMLCGALLLIAVEWYTYHRRITL